MPTTLVLGGPRSGKTRHAVSLLRGQDRVTYVATRARGHQAGHRTDEAVAGAPTRTPLPASWRTERTADLTRALLSARHPVLIDCLTGWIRTHLDDHGLWDEPGRAREQVQSLLAELVVAARAVPFPVVLVGQELTAGPLLDQPHHRLLVELNAEVNTELAAACSRVHAIIAGRVLDLSDAPVVR